MAVSQEKLDVVCLVGVNLCFELSPDFPKHELPVVLCWQFLRFLHDSLQFTNNDTCIYWKVASQSEVGGTS